MGQKLEKYYQLVADKGGLQAKMRLAMKTGMTSTKATVEPDTPENLELFYQAVRELLGGDVPKL